MNFKKIWSTAKAKISNAAFTVKVAVLTACIKILTPATAFAQDYASGTTALGDVTNELKKYIPIVTNPATHLPVLWPSSVPFPCTLP